MTGHHSVLPRILLVLLALAAFRAAPLAPQTVRWASVSVGEDHVCALDEQARAWCFGSNHAGQLGARTPERCGIVNESGGRGCYPVPSEATPLPAAAGMRFTAISVGRYASCATDARQRAWCWGTAIGNAAAYRDACLRGRACSFAPVPLLPERRIAFLNTRVGCAVDVEGTARCFAGAARDSLPWPGTTVRQVDGWPDTNALCAAGAEGRSWCRGDAVFGVPGNGSRDSALVGRPVAGSARFFTLAVLDNWVCGLDDEGAAFCWGSPGYGDVQRDSVPRPDFEQCERWKVRTWCNTRPMAVQGGLRFRSLAAMPRDSLGLVREMVGITPEGDAYVWNGRRAPRPWHPERRWRSTSAGAWGQCAVSTVGELFCWGRDPHQEVQGRIAHPGG